MRIIAVDDEKLAVDNITRMLRQAEPGAEILGFTEPEDAFRYLSENKADIAFLDIEMGASSGIEIARECKMLCPQINIIFVTGYSQYMMDAFRLHASGYLMKPVRAEDLRTELDNLRHPVLRFTKRVRIQTFGYFEIFVDGQILKFPRAKCRECLAYLVDRKGARVTYPELSAILWEDKPFDRSVQNNTQKVISDMIKTFREVKIESIVIKSRRDIAIDPEQVDCDYFAVLTGDVSQLNTFAGEYMSNYSWAEFTVGEIEKIRGQRENFGFIEGR